ncbi:MAG: 4Fe-4S cluster-binding domain-containing protein [Oscillospiraceae bacterium]|nr:4Fe-4S cluster-binding domain-containing protein [Oscillospiraceae bacterium]
MLVKTIIDEDFSNYKEPSMFIGTCYCDFKCCKEAGVPETVCQNSELVKRGNIEISAEEVYQRYADNPITSAIVLGGLEPMDQFDDVFDLIECFRDHGCEDTFVIYTGYEAGEINMKLSKLCMLGNITMKFGRYVPHGTPVYDYVLGVTLASDNQKGAVLC